MSKSVILLKNSNNFFGGCSYFKIIQSIEMKVDIRRRSGEKKIDSLCFDWFLYIIGGINECSIFS